MIFNFRQYSINEASRSEIEKVQSIFEDDLINQDFIKEMFGRTEFGYSDDYELDSEKDGAGDTTVWIDIKNPTAEALKTIDEDYKSFAKPYEEWCKKHDLYNPEILSTDDSLSFNVTLM